MLIRETGIDKVNKTKIHNTLHQLILVSAILFVLEIYAEIGYLLLFQEKGSQMI